MQPKTFPEKSQGVYGHQATPKNFQRRDREFIDIMQPKTFPEKRQGVYGHQATPNISREGTGSWWTSNNPKTFLEKGQGVYGHQATPDVQRRDRESIDVVQPQTFPEKRQGVYGHSPKTFPEKRQGVYSHPPKPTFPEKRHGVYGPSPKTTFPEKRQGVYGHSPKTTFPEKRQGLYGHSQNNIPREDTGDFMAIPKYCNAILSKKWSETDTASNWTEPYQHIQHFRPQRCCAVPSSQSHTDHNAVHQRRVCMCTALTQGRSQCRMTQWHCSGSFLVEDCLQVNNFHCSKHWTRQNVCDGYVVNNRFNDVNIKALYNSCSSEERKYKYMFLKVYKKFTYLENYWDITIYLAT